MEIRDFQIFLAVADELHFGRAAEKLHMAQPPVSRAIRAMEATLGTQLFNRSTRSVELTPAGQALLLHARKIVGESALARKSVAAASRGDLGRISLAFAGPSSHDWVGRIAWNIHQNFPNLILTLESQNYASPALSRLLRGEVDLAIGRWEYVPPGLRSRTLTEERLVLVVPAAHPLSHVQSVEVQELADERFVSTPAYPGAVLPDRVSRLCRQAGFEPNLVQEAPDTLTALALVASGLGVLFSLSSVQQSVNSEQLRFIPIRTATEPIEVRLASSKTSDNPSLPLVLQIVEDLLTEEEAGATPPLRAQEH